MNSASIDDWTTEPATIVSNVWCVFFPAKPGCRIALFQETYPHLTLKKVYDDVIFRGTIHVSCDLEKGWRGQGEATCLGTNHWRVPTCSSKLNKIFSYVLSESTEWYYILVQLQDNNSILASKSPYYFDLHRFFFDKVGKIIESRTRIYNFFETN